MPRNLIVVRCGRNSLHWQWLEGGRRNWDLALCPFETIESRGFPSAQFPGQKWRGLYEYFISRNEWREYDYICMPDDDIAASAETWSAFFDYCETLQIKLAAPALTQNSFFSHVVTLQNTALAARSTTFVEIMNPCLSRAFLEETLPTMELSRSGTGFGLDSLWPLMASYKDVWVIDDTPVFHTRPIGGGRAGALGQLSAYDARFLIEMGMPTPHYCTGGYTRERARLPFDSVEFIALYRRGFAYLELTHPNHWPLIRDLAPAAAPVPSGQVLTRLAFALEHLKKADPPVSRDKPCLVSSVSPWLWTNDPALGATGGNDGRLNGVCGFHTSLEVNPWWQVDLSDVHDVAEVVIYNRLDQKERFIDFNVVASVDGRTWTIAFSKQDGVLFGGADGNPFVAKFSAPTPARFVRVQALGYTYLHLDQIEVFGARQDASRAVETIPNVSADSAITSVIEFERLIQDPRGRFLFEKAVRAALQNGAGPTPVG